MSTYEEVMNDLKMTFEEAKEELLPLPKHKSIDPLGYAWLKTLYWDFEWTAKKIALYLNTSTAWVDGEIKRLDLQKTKNGIKLRGKKGYKQSDAERKIRQNQPHARKVQQLDLNGGLIETFRSKKYAAKCLKVTPTHITRAIREPHRTCGGFKWRYAKIK